jgi:MFS family permease
MVHSEPASKRAAYDDPHGDQVRHWVGSRLAWWVVVFLWFTFLLNYVDRQLVFSIFPMLRRDLGFTDAQLGLVGSLFIWTYCLCMPLAGWLADRIRRERLILISLILWSLATLGTAVSRSISDMLFWRIVMGITESLYAPAAFGLIGLLHSEASRSTALSVHSSAQFAGIVCGAWYGGWTADHWGWRPGFVLLAVVGMIYAIVLGASCRRIPVLASETATPSAKPVDIFLSRCYLVLILVFVSFGIMQWMLYAWLPDLIYEHYHLTLAQSGLTATLYLQGGSVAGLLMGGALADRLTTRVAAARFYIVGMALLLCAPFAYFTVAVHRLALLKLCAASFGFFAGFMMVNTFAAAYDVISRRNFGFATGILNGLPGGASGTAIFLAGVLKQSVGIVQIMFYGAVAASICALLVLVTTALRFDQEYALARAETAIP